MRDLTGKRVLLTGAGRGIGLEMARAFAAAGAGIVLTDVDAELLGQAVEQLQASGAEVHHAVLDVTDDDAIVAVRDRLLADVGPVDVLVNNAGVVFGGNFLEVPMSKHRLTYAINTMGLVAVTHAWLPQLLTRPEAHLVNIASASGLIGLPFGATYASSKWSVLGFSESIRLELKHLGHDQVGVTAICPGYVNTGMFDGVSLPRFTRLLEPEALANQVVDAVRNNESVVLEPFLVKLLPLMKGLLPRRVFDWIAWETGTASSMKKWKGRG